MGCYIGERDLVSHLSIEEGCCCWSEDAISPRSEIKTVGAGDLEWTNPFGTQRLICLYMIFLICFLVRGTWFFRINEVTSHIPQVVSHIVCIYIILIIMYMCNLCGECVETFTEFNTHPMPLKCCRHMYWSV